MAEPPAAGDPLSHNDTPRRRGLRYDCFVVTTPGLEVITEGELNRLGVTRTRRAVGGIDCSLTIAQLYRCNLWLRTATRILVRVGRFRAERFDTLSEGLRRVPWESWLSGATRVRVSASSTRSELYHTGAIEERVIDSLPDGSGPAGEGAQVGIWIRVDRNAVTVSIDSSGEALHKRGWRVDAGPAPLRETLAAALVLWSGWKRSISLVDPCCGAGTIAIEAASIAVRSAPGRHRAFAFMAFPGFDSETWQRAVAGADADSVPSKATIFASDVDAEIVAIAAGNVTRAGVDVVCSVADVIRVDPPRGSYVVTNPPHGLRLGGDLRGLYSAVGALVPPAGRLAVVAARRSPTSAFGHRWVDQLATRSGGEPVRFLRTG
jgi:putative N6-adenine-specific DNA methylase